MKKLILMIIGSLVKNLFPRHFLVSIKITKIYIFVTELLCHTVCITDYQNLSIKYMTKKCLLFLIFQSFVLSPNVFASLGEVLSCRKIYRWILTTWPIWWSVWQVIAQQCYTVVSLSPRVFLSFFFFTHSI